MGTSDLRRAATEMLGRANHLRSLFPDAAAIRAVALPDVPPEAVAVADAALYAAIRYVRDEAAAVQVGLATAVDVLDEELGHLRRALQAAALVRPVAAHGPPTTCCHQCRTRSGTT